MDRFTDLRQENEITVVLFYAPWCGQSLAAAREFNRTAKILHKQVQLYQVDYNINYDSGCLPFPRNVCKFQVGNFHSVTVEHHRMYI